MRAGSAELADAPVPTAGPGHRGAGPAGPRGTAATPGPLGGGYRGGRRRGLGPGLVGNRGGQLPGHLGLQRLQVGLAAVGLAEIRGAARLVRLVLGLLLAERGLVGLERALGGAQLVEGGGDVPDRDRRVLTGRLRRLTTAGEQARVRARGPAPVVHVGPDRLLLDQAGLGGDQLLVLPDLLPDLPDRLTVGGHLGGRHGVLLLIGADLQLLLHQLLRHRPRLGLQIGDLVGPRGSERSGHREGGHHDEGREEKGRDRAPARPSCVWSRQRSEPGVKHNGCQT